MNETGREEKSKLSVSLWFYHRKIKNMCYTKIVTKKNKKYKRNNLNAKLFWMTAVGKLWKITINGEKWIGGWIKYEIEAEWVYFHMKEVGKEKELYMFVIC